MFQFFLTCQSCAWISYLKGRRRLSLSVPGTQEPRGVKVGDRRGSLAVSDLERRDVPEGGQVDVDGPKVAPVQDLRQEEYKDQRSLKWGMGRTGSTVGTGSHMRNFPIPEFLIFSVIKKWSRSWYCNMYPTCDTASWTPNADTSAARNTSLKSFIVHTSDDCEFVLHVVDM